MSEEQRYIVTARKWRPLRFSDVVGQEHITTTLKNAIGKGRIHHAYVFNLLILLIIYKQLPVNSILTDDEPPKHKQIKRTKKILIE